MDFSAQVYNFILQPAIETLNMFIDKNIETHSEGIKRKKSGKRKNTHLQKIIEYKAELMSELPKEQVTRLTILNDSDFVVELSYGLLKADNVKCYNISAYPWEYQYSNKLMPVRLNDSKIKVYDFLPAFEKYSIKCISINDSYNEILDLYNKLVEQLRFKLTSNSDYKNIRRQKIQYLNKKIINKNYDSYFAYKQSLNKTRKILSRGENRYYLFKPYGDKPAIALMEIAYSNTCNKEFKKKNKAYLVIDNNSVSNLIKLSRGNSDDYTHSQTGKGYMIASDYTFCGRSTLCGENTCLNLAGEKFIGGAWSTIHSSKGTKQFDRSAEYDSTYLNILSKKKCHDYIHHMQNNGKVAGKGGNIVAPNTDGLITTIAKFYKKSSKMTISLHQWLKCKSIGVKPAYNPDSILIHIGHTFDNRINYLKWLNKGYERKNNDDFKIKSIVKEFYENEKKKGIYRSEYVPVGIGYFSNTLKCNCTAQIGMECKYCEGVLYINTIEGLKDLYDQLTSDEYSKLE